MAELLVWPALLAYGEAALAYAGDARRPGLAGRAAIWGVRLGWLAQTALLVAQAARADGFPWSSWAGALNLFAWLVVGAYLVWGCRPRFRLLGLGVMPVAVALLAVAYAGGGTGARGDDPGLLLMLHVGLMLAGFAGIALAAGLAGLYLWEERRLKRRAPSILRLRVPPLEVLDRLSLRTLVAGLAALTAGMAFGVASLVLDGGSVDAAMGLTVAAWLAFAALAGSPLRGRRRARALVAASLLVVVALAATHFA